LERQLFTLSTATSYSPTPTNQEEENLEPLITNLLEPHLDEFNHRYEILATEILNLKNVVMNLQSYTMEVNKMLVEERVRVLSDPVTTTESPTILIHDDGDGDGDGEKMPADFIDETVDEVVVKDDNILRVVVDEDKSILDEDAEKMMDILDDNHTEENVQENVQENVTSVVVDHSDSTVKVQTEVEEDSIAIPTENGQFTNKRRKKQTFSL
ncbi:MAG: hypothetical protein EBU93_05790, partial [Chlamydiae bacterium]|nr:hypothetical protein [Chlamydiota bacterium]